MARPTNLYQVAQQVTDEVLGEGAYVKLNGFDPAKGQTHQGDTSALCQWCEEPVLSGDEQALPYSLAQGQMHSECAFRSVVGSVAHVLHWCGCYQPGSDLGDPVGLTKRQAARAAFALSRQLMDWFGPGPR
jgi:hypothetical protein